MTVDGDAKNGGASLEGLEISVTNEFDANLASITHRLNDTEAVAGDISGQLQAGAQSETQ